MGNRRSTINNSLALLTAFYCIASTVNGMVAPFLTVYIAKISGGMDKLGIALSITILFSAASVVVAGKYSDRVGRVPFLIGSAVVDALVFVAYTFVTEPFQIYIIQALIGMVGSVAMVMAQALIADLTDTGERGKQMGLLSAMVSVSTAAGLVAGGYAIKIFGLNIVLYLAAVVILCSTPLLFILLRLQSPLKDSSDKNLDLPALGGVVISNGRRTE